MRKASNDPPVNEQKRNNANACTQRPPAYTYKIRICSVRREWRACCVRDASKAVTSQPIKANTSRGCIFSRVEIVFCQSVLCDTFPFPLLRAGVINVFARNLLRLFTRAHTTRHIYSHSISLARPFEPARVVAERDHVAEPQLNVAPSAV